MLLLITNDDDDEKYYYFAVKSKLELYSSEWLKNKKEAIINGNNCFQNALNDALDHQRIKKDLQKYQKVSHILASITGKIQNIHRTKKTRKSLNKIIRQLP